MNHLVGRSTVGSLRGGPKRIACRLEVASIDSCKHLANFRLDLRLGNAISLALVDILTETLLGTGRIWHGWFGETSGSDVFE